MQRVIVVEKHHVASRCFSESVIACGGSFGAGVVTNGRERSLTRKKIRGIIGRRIIDDDQLPRWSALASHAVDRFCQKLPSVVGRDHHAHDDITGHGWRPASSFSYSTRCASTARSVEKVSRT